MSLDGGGRPLERHGLDDVRIERALGQPRDVAELPSLVIEHRDELRADRLALDLGIRHTIETIYESLACLDMDQVHLECIAECPDDRLHLPLPQQPVVHEEARELIA